MKKTAFYLTLLLITYILVFIVNHPDYDLWARLAVGSIFYQTGGVLRQDIFAYTPVKQLWIDHEWASSVIFFTFVNYLGKNGLFIIKAILVSAIFILIIKTIRLHKDKTADIEVLYPVLIAFAMLPGLANLVRCHLFTYFFFILWIYLLEIVRNGEKRLIWLFPVTMLLWANMHGGFVAGLGLVFIYAAGEFLNGGKPVKYLIILALSSLVTLINPYGIDYWHYIAEAATMPRPFISEWKPIDLFYPVNIINGVRVPVQSGFFLLALLTLIVAVKLFINKSKYDWVKILLVIITFYLSLKHQRNTSFFILAVASLFYHQYIALFDSLKLFIKDKHGEKSFNIAKLAKNIASYALIIVIGMYFIPRLSRELEIKPIFYPVGSIEFIKQNNLSGNVATNYGWGSYTFWKLYPDCKVSIDGRYEEVYPNDVYNSAMDLSEHLSSNWYKLLDQYHTDIIILSKIVYKPQDIVILKGWKVVYEDLLSIVLLPVDKIKNNYIYPDFRNKTYWHEDLSKHIYLPQKEKRASL